MSRIDDHVIADLKALSMEISLKHLEELLDHVNHLKPISEDGDTVAL